MVVYYGKTRGLLSPVGAGTKQAVIWGDRLDVAETSPPSANFEVSWKRWNARTGARWIQKFRVPKADCQQTPLLEMVFLDVGQGDGCILSMPDGAGHKMVVIDAGAGTNMSRFLKWKTRGEPTAFEAAVITHSDTDHYKGFQAIFADPQYSFGTVYHNGLIERVAANDLDVLGTRQNGFCTEVIADKAALQALLSPTASGTKLYPKLMNTALGNPARFGDIRMASTLTGVSQGGRAYLLGFAPAAGQPAIEILGPVPVQSAGGLKLKAFGTDPDDGGFDVGKTKNGNSVILRLEYNRFSAVFGGDLNRPAEDYLLRHYGGIGPAQPLSAAVAQARTRLSADLLKCCHHGSADVTDEFVEAVEPFAFVVSSGDEESHVHPRPEILGLLGKKGRGARPMILCTEILRSTPESKALTSEERAELDGLQNAYDAISPTDTTARKKAKAKIDDFWSRRFKRLVNVYGAINVRTDGQKLIFAFMKEKEGSGSPWQVYEFHHDGQGWKGDELDPH